MPLHRLSSDRRCGRRMFEAPAPKAPVNVEALDRRARHHCNATTRFHYEHAGSALFDAPPHASKRSHRSSRPSRPARILAGSTDIGLWVTKQMRELGNVVYVGTDRRIAEARNARRDGSKLARASP